MKFDIGFFVERRDSQYFRLMAFDKTSNLSCSSYAHETVVKRESDLDDIRLELISRLKKLVISQANPLNFC